MLDALCQSTTPQTEWKIVAVNNNSTDNTNDILHSYLTRLPMEIYFEINQGKAAAIDRGFKYIEGKLVIITDDDVRPAQDWIEQFLKLAEGCPDYDMFGGLILPEWEQLPEPWVLEWVDHVSVYALNETVKEGPISAGYIFGPNSAFRRGVLPDKYSVHDSCIGPSSDVQQYPMGCDTLFARSIETRGHKAWHSRLPVVQHFVPAKYLDERWIFQRAERHGLGMPVDAFMQRIGSPECKEALRRNTEELVARGGFGSPTLFVNGEDMYFGNDRLPLVERALARAVLK